MRNRELALRVADVAADPDVPIADRHQRNDESARAYMASEQALPAQIATDGLMQVKLTGRHA